MIVETVTVVSKHVPVENVHIAVTQTSQYFGILFDETSRVHLRWINFRLREKIILTQVTIVNWYFKVSITCPTIFLARGLKAARVPSPLVQSSNLQWSSVTIQLTNSSISLISKTGFWTFLRESHTVDNHER